MTSRNLNVMPPDVPDGRWQGAGGDVLVELKRTNSMRDIRHALLALAYRLRQEPTNALGVCVLVDSRLSARRLHHELDHLREVVHPKIAGRLHFLVATAEGQGDGTVLSGSFEGFGSDFYPWLKNLVAAERLRGQRPQRQPRQAVIAALAQLRLWNHPPVTVRYLQDKCRASYPTVAAVLKDFAEKGWLENASERGVQLRHLTIGEWMDLAHDHAKQRSVALFTDPTGQNSPSHMVQRLVRLQRAHRIHDSVRVGGVLGAAHHFPQLNITAAPRLDLSVDADPMQIAEVLDAGLRLKTRAEQHTALAVHVALDPWDAVDGASDAPPRWAGQFECLADLIEMGFTHEASELAGHMEQDSEKRPRRSRA